MMAYHTSRYTNTIVCTCQVLVQRIVLLFVSICETVGTMDLLCFPRKLCFEARNCLLRLLTGSKWGAHASVLRTSPLALCRGMRRRS